MATSSVQDEVRTLVEPAVAGAGLVVESVEIKPAGRRSVLRVIVDLPDEEFGGVSSDALEEASRAVSLALDSSDVMGAAPYTLEVTSPGIDRPLTQRRHWLRARRRLVLVTTADGRSVEGRLREVDDDGVRVEETRLSWADVVRGKMQVDFKGMQDDDLLDDPDSDAREGEGED